jgi:hypothetical protein
MVGMELDLALIVRQLPVESAYGLHALPPVLRKGFGSRGEGVADHPLVQLVLGLNIKNMKILMRVFCKKIVTFPAKIRQKTNKN